MMPTERARMAPSAHFGFRRGRACRDFTSQIGDAASRIVDLPDVKITAGKPAKAVP
jgi:hypothetical protein